jgi:hypothetical protein
MGELKVSMLHYACKSCASLNYLAGHRDKSNTHNYPSEDSEIVADDMSIPVKQNWHISSCYGGWLWPQICTNKEKVT